MGGGGRVKEQRNLIIESVFKKFMKSVLHRWNETQIPRWLADFLLWGVEA